MDLYERENSILNSASQTLAELQRSETEKCDIKLFSELLDEYERLLKLLIALGRNIDESISYILADRQKYVKGAYTDELTQISNRKYLEEHGRDIYKVLSRSNGTLSVMMIDVDYFKKYNDSYGHGEGDKCLKIVARAIADSASRAGDFAARYGGEEFTVVLPNADKKGACSIANIILENVRGCNIPHKENEDAGIVTVSIGVTTGGAEQSQTFEKFLECADKALYESKNNGRNKYTFKDIDA
jgi:diguanylate cyclase (GGDEF)-like protein